MSSRKPLSLNASPSKQIRSPLNSSPNRNKHFWQNVFKKEQEKVQKKAQMIQQSSTNEQTMIEDDDNDDEDFQEKPQYVQACFDRDFIKKKSLMRVLSKSRDKQSKDVLKEKNTLTDLPDPQSFTLHNGVNFSIKKAFGQYQMPISKCMNFISDTSVIFLIGNYIALHNLHHDETKYIGIEANLSDISCFEVQTVDTILKGDFSFNALPTQPNTSSPSKQLLTSTSLFQDTASKSDVQSPILLAPPQLNSAQSQLSHSAKELMTLIAFAEKAKEVYLKESKFSSKKVYGISNANRKKQTQGLQSPLMQQNSPGKMGRSQSALNVSSDDQHFLRFIVKVNIFNLHSPQKRYVLQHIFDEYFYVQQIYLRDKESFCYTLCTNKQGEQLFFIWNFRKETIMASTELKAKILKFNVSPHKNELILFLGEKYLKYHEANFTNKLMKENSLNIVPMKIEKESNFVDIEYLPKTDIFIIITDSNCAFVFEKNALKFKLLDQIEELGQQTDSVISDTLEIGDLSDNEAMGKEEEHLIIKNIGTNPKKDTAKPSDKQQAKNQFVFDNDGEDQEDLNEMSSQRRQDEGSGEGPKIKFQKVLVTQRGFMVGASNGYFFLYEFQKEEQPPKLMFQVHLSNRIKSVVSMSLSRGIPKNEEYLVAIAGVYKKQVNGDSSNGQNFEGSSKQKGGKQSMAQKYSSMAVGGDQMDANFFMPKLLESPKKGQNQNFMKQGSITSVQNQMNMLMHSEHEEKLEFQIINLRSIQTQQLNKIVQKIFSKGCHDGSIFQIAQAKHKSWLYTISEGSNLKIWNHTNEWNGVANYVFDEQPICIDVHPSSWQICLGFKSGIRIYQSLDKCLKLQFEKLGKAALALQYSDGGQYLAMANAVHVEIIDPMKMQVLCTLFGHKGLIRTITWTPNGKYLISSCSNGGIFFWKGNFKQQTNGQVEDITPLACLNDKNYLYQQICYDEELDILIALTNTSQVRIFLSAGLDCVYEENLLTLQSCQEGQSDQIMFLQQVPGQYTSLKVNCMCFSRSLGILVIGYSNGKIGVINWPIAPNKKTFKYEIFLQQAGITDVIFTHNQRYLAVSTDDGSIFVLETFRVMEGKEKQWMSDNQEYSNIKKRREHNGLRGYCLTDNFIMCNKSQLEKVNKKVEKLELQIKTHEVNYKIKVAKKLKKFEKQKKLIEKDLHESLDKQNKLIEALEQEFQNEKDKLQTIRQEQTENNESEKQILRDNKEQNLSFVHNENDELENRILRLKQSIVNELEKIEEEHSNAVLELVNSYEQSIKSAQEEVKNTIDKLKTNGAYYEGMISLQETDYEGEIHKLQSDLIDETYHYTKKKDKLDHEDNLLRDEFQDLEDTFKMKNHQRKAKLEEVKRLGAEQKNQETNIERLFEKDIQSNIFIDEKEKSIFNTYMEKRQLENLIIFFSSKIKELKDERKPLEEKKKQMEIIIEETYRELQDDFQFRKYMELKQEGFLKKMEIIEQEIKSKEDLNKEINEKMRVFKRELSYLKEAKSLRGWILKVQGMLTCMKQVQQSLDPEQARKVSMQFIHIAEIMESNARPYRANQVEDELVMKQSKMNEMDLAYHRNKSSEKLRELKFRFKQLFKQLEKQIFKLRSDNVKLIEEFNTLQNEHKKLNNLRHMIKEGIKELLGDDFDQKMVNSSDEDSFKKKREEQRTKKQNLNRSKSTVQTGFKGEMVSQQQALTSRDLYTSGSKQTLPDLKNSKGGSLTQRDRSESKKHLAGGFNMNKNAEASKKRIMNTITNKSISHNTVGKVGENRKYLEKIVEEFEKNRRQIEEQTKSMQNIQKQMNLLMNTQDKLSQSTQSNGNLPKTTLFTVQAAVPALNLASLAPQQKPVNYSGKQTFTTRIPNTSDRTTISVLDQALGVSSSSQTNRKLPVIKESEYQTQKEGNN